jgi:short-subunit dehydrogenase
MSIFKPVTVITGASVGIGRSLAKVFAAHGHEVALVARREPELRQLAQEIAAAGGRAHVIPVDLSRADAPARISHELLGRGLEPGVVVNNAGFGLWGSACELDRGEQLAMIELNVRTLTDMSLRWVETLARHNGGILNVASVAAFVPGPNMAVYYATKAYVLSFSEALHRELEDKNVRVTVVCPGPVKTEFQARAGMSDGMTRSPLALSADDVAKAAYAGFAAGKRLVIPGIANKLAAFLPRLAPRSWVLSATRKFQKRAAPKPSEGWPRRQKA